MSYDPEMTVIGSVIIAKDGTDSTVLVKKHYKNLAIFLPANWVTSVITLKGCDTKDGTFVPLVYASDGSAVTISSVAASKCVIIDGVIRNALAVPYLMLISAETQTVSKKIITIVMMR